jgi:glycosyltransferase involved in cell wall biosynthesis
MRILFLTQYFPPETGAAQNRLLHLSEALFSFGHAVTVLTAMPSYPAGKVSEPYRRRFIVREQLGGVRVMRVWSFVTCGKGFFQRLCNYFSFAISSLLFGIAGVGRHDIIVVESPPLFLGVTGLLLAAIWRARLVFNVSDLWPESAVAMGVVRAPYLIRAATGLEEFIYRRSDLITGQTEGIVTDICSRVPAKPVHLLTNGVVPQEFSATPEQRAGKRKELGVGDAFVVGYAGLHGLAQHLQTVIDAAAEVRASNVLFVLVGDGPEKSALQKYANEKGIENVRFFPPQPKSEMAALLSAFDAVVVPLRKLDLFRGALPSKLFEGLASGKPVIASVAGEAQRLLERSGGGICVAPEDSKAIAIAVLSLVDAPARCKSLGIAGRLFITENYNRATIAHVFGKVLLALGPAEQSPIARKVAAEGSVQKGA